MYFPCEHLILFLDHQIYSYLTLYYEGKSSSINMFDDWLETPLLSLSLEMGPIPTSLLPNTLVLSRVKILYPVSKVVLKFIQNRDFEILGDGVFRSIISFYNDSEVRYTLKIS